MATHYYAYIHLRLQRRPIFWITDEAQNSTSEMQIHTKCQLSIIVMLTLH